jgi:hypothetical protein
VSLTPAEERDRELAAQGVAESYRAEIARVLHQAAATGFIPQRIRLGRQRAVIDLGSPAECCWYVDHLLRSDHGRRWAYMGALPGYSGLQPELGQAIAALRDIMAAELAQEAAQRKLGRLQARVAAVQAARGALLAQWTGPIEAVHAATPPMSGL